METTSHATTSITRPADAMSILTTHAAMLVSPVAAVLAESTVSGTVILLPGTMFTVLAAAAKGE
jgi:hypothetical protein